MIMNHDLTQYHEQYTNAKPYNHIILDDVFDPQVLDKILEEWPSEDNPTWSKKECATSYKWDISHVPAMGPTTQKFIQEVNSPEIAESIGALTGIEGLCRDPYMEGAGLHHIPEGGFLKMHLDFNWHPQLKKVRRVNMLVYLNKDWQEGDGGEIEVWNPEITELVAKEPPRFNRILIFSLNTHSWHGHPDPGAKIRRSVAFYFYANNTPSDYFSEEGKAARSTLYRRRPGESF